MTGPAVRLRDALPRQRARRVRSRWSEFWYGFRWLFTGRREDLRSAGWWLVRAEFLLRVWLCAIGVVLLGRLDLAWPVWAAAVLGLFFVVLTLTYISFKLLARWSPRLDVLAYREAREREAADLVRTRARLVTAVEALRLKRSGGGGPRPEE